MRKLLIEVHGFVMLKGLKDGFKYLLIEKNHEKYGLVYEVKKPLGKNTIIMHYKSSVDNWINSKSKINYIEILSEEII